MRLSFLINIFYDIYNNIKRMATKWTEHVKDFSKQKGITYGEAMKNDECKKMYQSSKKSINIEEVIETTRPKPSKPVKTPKLPKIPKTIPKEEIVEEVMVAKTPKKASKKNKSI
jgi:hypothetical protein